MIGANPAQHSSSAGVKTTSPENGQGIEMSD
jgi:hypothetical protein